MVVWSSKTMQILYYFLIGAILDILGTLDVQAVQKRKPLMSGIVSFIGSVISILIGTFIAVDFVQTGNTWLMVAQICSYSLGGSIGGSSMIILDIKNRKKKRQQQRKKKEASNESNTGLSV